ncbi:MAG: hypothetical protein ACKOB1_03430, partial [Planctomycetia bacterium]
PKLGPRPDHILDPASDRAAIDLAGLELLGPRQLAWLTTWAGEWEGVRAKCALSQTAFCGAVHLHGEPENRLLADLDSNGWPQSGRNAALRILKTAKAAHLCGDQHLAVVVKHGIDAHGDGPWAFTDPADVSDEKQLGDGYGIARWEFAKPGVGRAVPGTITFECWPRFPVLVPDGKPQQYPGWPVETSLPE